MQAGSVLSSKRDGEPSPNDLFWANRGKKSTLPAMHAVDAVNADDLALEDVDVKAITNADENDDAEVDADASGYWPGARQRRSLSKLNMPRPNSFMNMYMQKKHPDASAGKRSAAPLRSLRPNSFLFPSMPKRNLKFLRPNSHLFPSLMPAGSKRGGDSLKNLRPNSFLFPIPKRATFFAGRGKRGEAGEEAGDDLNLWFLDEKRSGAEADERLDMASFFAGRGKRGGEDLDDGQLAAFFAGRGKRDRSRMDIDPEMASFFAGRGKRGEADADMELASFFAGRGKKDDAGAVSGHEAAFFAGRGKREATKKDADDGTETFWAVRG